MQSSCIEQYGAHHIFSGHFHRNALAHCEKYAVTQIITRFRKQDCGWSVVCDVCTATVLLDVNSATTKADFVS
jgi:hypothetical protein